MHQNRLPLQRTPPAPTPRTARIAAAAIDRSYKGELDEVVERLPEFERVPFGTQAGASNAYLDAIVRCPDPVLRLPEIPVGVVSKRYQLVTHGEAALAVRHALCAAGVHPREMDAEAHLSVYGARMALFVRMPRSHDFDPGDGQPMALRVILLNSVDGSSPLRVLLGWYRFVCANGLVVGTTRSELRLAHREGARPEVIDDVLREGMQLAARERTVLKIWRDLPIDSRRLVTFTDEDLASAWGVRAAARFLVIATTGFDAEPADPFEPGPPHAKTMLRTRRVPGSPDFARTAWEACQALAWIAKDRRDPAQGVERMMQIPELMQALLNY